MFMQAIDKKLQKQVKTVSKKLGLNEREFINRSVSAYLLGFQKVVSLKKELSAWDFASALSIRKNNF